MKLNDLAKRIKEMQQENEFNEIDVNHLKGKLEKLQEQLHQPADVLLREQSTSFIDDISLLLPTKKGNHMENFVFYLD